jgi:two-component system sensor histidine kinase/response regulator
LRSGRKRSGRAEPFEHEHRLQARGWQDRLGAHQVSPIIEGGRASGFTGLIEDITTRKDAERELHESNQRLELALWASNIGLWSWDVKSDHAHFAPEWKRMLGYEPHELPDERATWESRLHPDERAAVLENLQSFLRTPAQTLEGQFRLRHRDGRHLWILARAKCEVDVDGKPVRIFGAHVDITAQRHAERAARHSEQLLELVVNALPHPMWIKDENFRWAMVNRAFADLHGRTPDSFVGKDDYEVFPAGAALAREQDQLVFDSGASMSFEDPLDVPGTSRRWFIKSKTPVTLERKRYLVGMAIDISERRAAELAVERSREFLNQVMEAIPHSVFVKDRNHRWVMVNRAFEQLHRHSRDELLGKSDYDVFDPEMAKRAWAHDERTFSETEPVVLDELVHFRGGYSAWLNKTKVAFKLSDGSEYLVGINQDITRQREAAQAIERNRQFLDDLINALPAPIFVKDAQHRWVHVNDEFCRMFGASRGNLLGKDDSSMLSAWTAAERFREDDEVLSTDRPLVREQMQAFPTAASVGASSRRRRCASQTARAA